MFQKVEGWSGTGNHLPGSDGRAVRRLAARPRRGFLFPVVLGVLGAVLATDAAACRCVPRLTHQYYEAADRVVLGKVVSEQPTQVDGLHGRQGHVAKVLVFRVDEVFKGSVGRQLEIQDRRGVCDSEIFLRTGDRALLFLAANGSFDACNGSQTLRSVGALQEEFGVSRSEALAVRARLKSRIDALRTLASAAQKINTEEGARRP